MNIATVSGVNNTTYLDINSNASNIAELFAVRAYDTCGNFSDTTLPFTISAAIAKSRYPGLAEDPIYD